VLSEAEVAAAPNSLATPDRDRDGQLSSDELRPMPPGGRDGRDRGRR
jgi:hypothetical protein